MRFAEAKQVTEDIGAEEPGEIRAAASPEAVSQLKGALTKIGTHIGNANKFSKASALLRKLLDEDKLVPEVGDETFQVCVWGAVSLVL